MNRLSIAASLTAMLAGAAPAHALTDAQFQKIASDVFLPVAEKYDIPGLAVGVAIGEKTFFFTHGDAVRATHMPVTTDTLFELGSVSKLFNVTLAELAQQRGLLAMTDSVSTHMPALKGTAFDDITLINLATHTTGGLPLQVPDGVSDAGRTLTAYLQGFEPKGAPDAGRSYSNVSIGLLGKITAERFGKPYGAAVAENLFGPLGLSSTFIDVPAQAEQRYAFGYAKDSNRPVRVNPGVLDDEAYGVKSSVADMTRFLQANLGTVDIQPRLFDALAATRTGYFATDHFTQDLIWEQYAWPVDAGRLEKGNSSDMAMKMQPARRLDSPIAPGSSKVYLNKTGGTGGFGSYVALVPSEEIGVVVLANRNYPNPVRARATIRLIEEIMAASAR